MRDSAARSARVEPSAPTAAQAAPGHPMDLWISAVLRYGVLTAGVIILIGLVLYIIQGTGAGGPASLHELTAGGGHSISVTPADIVRGVAHGHAIAVIQLGVLALILTPITRVAMTMVLFLATGDRIFTLITAAVLLILIFGLIGIAG